MDIEDELSGFLLSNIKDGSNKARDIEIIKFYYGLNESPWPTYEETASRFGGVTRQRIEQLIKSKFKDAVYKNSIPFLKHVGWAELAKPNVYRAANGFYKLTLPIIKPTITASPWY